MQPFRQLRELFVWRLCLAWFIAMSRIGAGVSVWPSVLGLVYSLATTFVVFLLSLRDFDRIA